nr:MAG TPA: hypothetical protein [Bacteriophage sp.]
MASYKVVLANSLEKLLVNFLSNLLLNSGFSSNFSTNSLYSKVFLYLDALLFL